MRVVSFNANGIRSAARLGFYEWLENVRPDVVCLQETRAHHAQLSDDPQYFPAGYHCEYVDAEKKGYSGVAIYARHAPERIVRHFGYARAESEGRYLRFDYPGLSIISAYFPSGTSSEERQAIKYEFLEHFAPHVMALRESGQELIICGDYNIAHKPIDLKNWRSNQKNSGFLPDERAFMDRLFGELGFVDAFRLKNPHPDEYTWWSHRGRARENNVGWRIDYQVITQGLVPRVGTVEVYREQKLSDHAPVLVQYEGGFSA
ncbi:hypothetical protein Lgee_2170 [Legionella geestiana]|uniref:Uncharacterized protein n=1 Tax=Legionella geestiana TaxID=45065 RepID=A0A0W0TLM5_9GAMM|nr:exodeoxyribonuclease III [Legionella geestiana]KTC96487.1 hypothetical protein Lgee_2170 [Legionella geestiana]QBS12529.1 exodeoxyribonuclease III [Legionella geestiana]QDQ39755.1 exodeoxyribonuclease III [Legionella geestiana]STX55025.1 exodeoxyribonuclease III [Legionella geestiana]